MSDGIRYYRGAIWTNHALERLGQRGLSQDMAADTFNRPDASLQGKQSGTMEYQKRFGISLVTIIAKQNERNEWIILSCWIDPPLAGTEDAKKQEAFRNYKKAGFWKKVWLVFKSQLGA